MRRRAAFALLVAAAAFTVGRGTAAASAVEPAAAHAGTRQAGAPSVPAAAYDPLRLDPGTAPTSVDLTLRDVERNRELPVRVWLPLDTAPAPVILFSPGLGGSRAGYAYAGRHWAARGYVVVHLQHPGSDDAVWKDAAPGRRLRALRDAASVENFVLRADDVPAVLDALRRWNGEPGHPLHRRLDLEHVGMAGHSFGAVTTQAVAGQSFPVVGTRYTDPRIDAALAMSPSAPRRGRAADAFGSVRVPWLLMTGTRDGAPIGGASIESRREVYPALPPGGKYELVLHDAEHSAFSDRALPTDAAPRNPNHARAVLAISVAFWDAWLRDDARARAWLDGGGPRTVLATADGWQRK
jgi:predicted dienelactone hydrolase